MRKWLAQTKKEVLNCLMISISCVSTFCKSPRWEIYQSASQPAYSPTSDKTHKHMETQTSIKSVNELATLRNSAMSRRSAEKTKKKMKIDRRKSQKLSYLNFFANKFRCYLIVWWSECLLCLSVCVCLVWANRVCLIYGQFELRTLIIFNTARWLPIRILN